MLLYSVFRAILESEADVSFIVNRNAIYQGVPQAECAVCLCKSVDGETCSKRFPTCQRISLPF